MEQENQIEETPQLYSKTLILGFSIMFSTIFAAFLLMSNLRALGKNGARLQVLIFAILYVIATGVVIQTFGIAPSLTVIANVIGAAILNEFFWNKYIGRDTEYEKRGWIKPTLISLGIVLIVFFLLTLAM